jgi:hypothetical protein
VVKKNLAAFFLVLFSLGLYFSIIWAKPLAQFAQGVASYSTVLFFITFILYAFSFLAERRTGLPVGLTITLALCALALLNKWASGFSDNMLIGGLLPYKDAHSYYLGMQMLLNGSPIASTGLQAAGRPLFPGFLLIFMLFTQANLQWAIALIFACVAASLYIAARRVFLDYGIVAGALLSTFLFLYIRPFIGFTLSESAGFIFGCLAFLLLWNAAQRQNITDLAIGMVVLTLAVSIRTGAFFMLPTLILWSGWLFRGQKRFSFWAAGVSALASVAAFAVMNVLYPRLVVEPGGVTFGNFAYALYGQVHGGTGWNYAIKVMETHEPGPILQAALQFFLKHPLSFFIGTAKAYRDFFFSDFGLFEFMTNSREGLVDAVLWFAKLLLLGLGIFQAGRRWRNSPVHALLLAGLAGVILSIPFMPPIDGGSRFYASSVAFLFALAIMGIPTRPAERPTITVRSVSPLAGLSILVVLCALILPITLANLNRQPAQFSVPACPDDFEPFMAQVSRGSYIDLVQAGDCGLAPAICLSDFIENGTEPTTDDFYQELISQASMHEDAMRVALVVNWLNKKHYYLLGSPAQLDIYETRQVFTGCAAHIRTRNQNIYEIQAIQSP